MSEAKDLLARTEKMRRRIAKPKRAMRGKKVRVLDPHHDEGHWLATATFRGV